MNKSFDVFLSHNSKDKDAVRRLAQALRARSLKVWLDEWELIPGRPWQEALEEVIETCLSSAVLVGKDGLGPWQDAEMRACLSEFADRKLPVIPVLLPGAPEVPRLPIFLKRFTWVDLRGGLTEEGIDQLQWAVTGNRPNRSLEGLDKAPNGQQNVPYEVPFSIAVLGHGGSGRTTLGSALLNRELPDSASWWGGTTPSTLQFEGRIGDLPVRWIKPPYLDHLIRSEFRHSDIFNMLSEVDLLLLVNRALEIRLDASVSALLEEHLLPRFQERIILVLSHIDGIQPRKEWNETESCPGPTQLANISQCVAYWAGGLRLPISRVFPFSSYGNYNLEPIKDKIKKMADRSIRKL